MSAAEPWGPVELHGLRRRLAETHAEPWDLVVVGAGITGAGIARDAAGRGLRVLVLEAQDLAFGTSSRSSRLIHGGVRYLEQGEVGLVYEALRERQRLYAAAPHLVRPARFLFPTFTGDRLGPWKLRIGLTVYDTLNFHRNEGHTYLPAEAARAAEPLLATEGLRGAVQYEDAVTDDARLTLSVLQDARRLGAEVLTYAPVERIDPASTGHQVVLADGIAVACRHVVVATGPWTGPRLLGSPGDGLLALSKGIHIVMRAQDVPIRQPLVVQAPHQRRILFVVPWGNRTYLGTTDAPYAGDPGHSGVTEQDERELLRIIAKVLPAARLDHDRVVSAWSGVRPLVREPDSDPSNTATMSRRHRTVVNDAGVIGVVGGKLTTYRAMAEEAVDRVAEAMDAGATDSPVGSCVTDERPLVPGPPLRPEELADPLLADLAPRHGPMARALARRIQAQPDLAAPLCPGLPYRTVEVEQALMSEGCTHLIDVLRRRLPLTLTDPRLGAAVAPWIATALVDAWGGTARDVDEELDRYREAVARETRRTPKVPGGIKTGRRPTSPTG